MSMRPAEFRDRVGVVSGLGEESDFVRAAVEAEAENQRALLQERIPAVAADANQRAKGWVRARPQAEKDQQTQEFAPNPDAALRSKALAKRLERWAKELREEGFGSPEAPFPEDLAAAADWIEEQSTGCSSVDPNEASREIRRLADLAGLVVKPTARFLKYARPDDGHQKSAGVYPGTFFERLARETERVSETTPFQPEVLTAFVLTGLQPMISRVRITETNKVCRVPGDEIPGRWVTLRFNAADVSYEEVIPFRAINVTTPLRILPTRSNR